MVLKGVNECFQDLAGLYWSRQSFDWATTKGWGMTLTPCWWACDLGRKFRGSDTSVTNVVLDNGESTFKGFSCNNVFALIDALRPHLSPKATVQDSLPF